jgi:hypothetical protein
MQLITTIHIDPMHGYEADLTLEFLVKLIIQLAHAQ